MIEKRKPLAPELDRILRTLVIYVYEHRHQPSYAELAELCGLASVQRQIDRLAALGWLKITGVPRALEIPPDVYDEIVEQRKDREND